MADLGTILGGLSAAVGGTAPQFQRQMMQDEENARTRALQDEQTAEKRRATMFMDAAVANQFLQSGDLDSVAGIFEDRMNILSRIPNVDTRHTREKLGLVRAARSGDTQALSQLQSQLGNEVAVGRAYGILGKESETPASFRALDMQAEAAGIPKGSKEYQDFMRYGGASGQVGGSGSIRYSNGTIVQYLGSGGIRVLDPVQGEITDPAAKQEALKLAVASKPAEAGAIAQAQAQAKGQEERAQDIITQGQAAADSTAVIRRALQLLETVPTGGFNRITLAAKRLFGVEGADEGELSANLGKAVLAQLRDTFGAAFTAQEGESLKKIEAGFTSSPETNKRLLNNSLRIAERAAQRAIRRAESRDDFETSSEIESALDFDLSGFNNELSSIFEESEAGSLPMITTQAQFDALPSGAQYIEDDSGTIYRKP